ncbi:hypothetical protein SSOG_07559 [Streptomyces himastatinicus ATCC 53653]|uniref:Uncharacterized protein n=1 Tax=Streptomyces himastatinicus ATCC 53653 TaxID=457427 RepID=D9WMH9_9ACTN|nr:leucine-rich repeat domain-containing protein [Streptomyces himastatinicus]EFL27845.1 hypothetical protein SSOG_07559 [Streptomyces himastatinicus ATCC 53653]
MEPAIAEAITLEVGHPAPFRDEELDSIMDLVVHHARGSSGLERCKSLRILILSGHGSNKIPDLGGFPALESLTVSDSDVRDIGAVRTAPSLLVLSVERNLVADISPTLECARLTLLDVRGNPLSDMSYREVIPELRDKGVDVQASEEREWALTRALHAAGLPFSYYQYGDHHRLSRPGLTRTDTPEGGHIKITPQELEHLLVTSPSDIEALF